MSCIEICWHCGGQVMDLGEELSCVQCGREPLVVRAKRDRTRFVGVNWRLLRALQAVPGLPSNTIDTHAPLPATLRGRDPLTLIRK